jgi:hypothetical protein
VLGAQCGIVRNGMASFGFDNSCSTGVVMRESIDGYLQAFQNVSMAAGNSRRLVVFSHGRDFILHSRAKEVHNMPALIIFFLKIILLACCIKL